MKVKVQAHVAYQTQYHIVWIPKYRQKVFVPGVQEYLRKVLFHTIEERYPDVFITDLAVRPNHLHALVEIPPKYSISTVVGYIKGASAKVMRMHFKYLQHARGLWADGFYVSTVGADENTIKAYIQYQQKQERGQAELV